MSLYRLYWAPDTAAMVPEALLECAGLTYEKVRMNLDNRDQFLPEYKSINPLGRIPTLITPDGEIITETAAILIFLCETHDLDWMPKAGDPVRGQFLRFMFTVSNTIHTPYRRLYRTYDTIDDATAFPHIRAIAVDQIYSAFGAMNGLIKQCGGPFSLGEKRSVADLYLAAMVTWYPKFDTDLLPALPNLKTCYDAVLDDPVVRGVFESNLGT